MQPRSVAVLVSDATLAREARRAAVAAGAVVVDAADDVALARVWRAAAAVVIDAPHAERVAALGLGRRDAAVVVTGSSADVSAWHAAVAVGAEAVRVLPVEERVLLQWVVRAVQPAPVARLVGIVGGRGGAGASTLAAAVALACGSAGRPSLLLDTDPGGGGHDLLLGIEQLDGPRWSALTVDGAGGDIAGSLAALPVVAGTRVLSCDRETPATLPESLGQAVTAAALSADGTVVADLARPPDALSELVATRADVVAVVVPAEVRAVSAAGAVVRRMGAHCDDVRLVVRHPGPSDLRADDVAESLAAPVAGIWPWDRRLGRIVDTGRFARAWRSTTVAAVATQLAALGSDS